MKVGDYVRTNKGEICKVTSVAKDNLGFGNMEFCNTEPFVYGDIIKSSPNIIDLIEVGDYVNGVIVTQSYIDNIKHIAPEIKENNYGIKSIVTKEQFESMEYKIGE